MAKVFVRLECDLRVQESRSVKIMDIQELWQRALRHTEIRRSRIQGLSTFSDTHVPYIVLSESMVNAGDTVVRKGEVLIEKPAIILPPNIPQFLGFDFEGETQSNVNDITNFLFVRGVSLPSLRYNNKTHSLDVQEGGVDDTAKRLLDDLQSLEDVHTGLIMGPDDCWQFSLLIFICAQVARNAETDIRKLLDDYRKKAS